jgi:lipoprotein
MCSKIRFILFNLLSLFSVFSLISCFSEDVSKVPHFKSQDRDKRFFGKWQLVTDEIREGRNCYILTPDGTWQHIEKNGKPSGYAEYYYTEGNILYILDTGGGKRSSYVRRYIYHFSDDKQLFYTKSLDYTDTATWVRLKDK